MSHIISLLMSKAFPPTVMGPVSASYACSESAATPVHWDLPREVLEMALDDCREAVIGNGSCFERAHQLQGRKRKTEIYKQMWGCPMLL